MSNEKIQIRRAGVDDAGVIAGLTDAAYAKYIPLIGRKPQPMTADHSRMAAENPVWLLLIDEHPVGVLELEEEPETLLIYSVVIHPEYQHHGLGHRLLAWAEAEARRAGYAAIRLYTNEHFVDNIRLYLSLGYVETGREPYLGSNLVHMAKKLE